MSAFCAVLLAVSAASLAGAGECPAPPPASNFTFSGFEGSWFEIGKYQTFNPFEVGCECTKVGYNHTTGAFPTACVKNNKTVTATPHLIPAPSAPAGVFNEEFSFGPVTSTARLTIPGMGVYDGEEYLFEFDCSRGESLNYCFHAFTRSGRSTPKLVDLAQHTAEKLGLNPENLPWQTTKQTDCRY